MYLCNPRHKATLADDEINMSLLPKTFLFNGESKKERSDMSKSELLCLSR